MIDPEVVVLFGVLMNAFLCQEFSPWQCDRESKKRGGGLLTLRRH